MIETSFGLRPPPAAKRWRNGAVFLTRLLGLAATLAFGGCGGSPYYTTAPFSAQVVDADTKAPIAGAVVVADWHLVVGTLGGPRSAGHLEVRETVTDDNGRFAFEGLTRLNPGFLVELRGEDPQVLIFKGGYKLGRFANFYPKANTETPGAQRKAAVDGKTLELKKISPLHFDGQTRFHSGIDTVLGDILHDCEWHKIPRMLTALDEEHKRIKAIDPKSLDNLKIENFALDSSRDCKLTREALKAYRK